jgi:hypothetical protein
MVSIPRDFEFQRNLHLQFPPFWIEIWLFFLESSVKIFNRLWNSTLKKRYQIWHLRFDSFLILKYRDFCWTRSEISHFGEKIYGFIKNTKPSGKTQEKLQLKLNRACFSSRFCIFSNPSYFGLFWNQWFSFSKPRVFPRISFVSTKEKNMFWERKTLILD